MAYCRECGAKLNQYNPGTLCSPCQERHADEISTADDRYYDVQQLTDILGFESAESTKRLIRQNMIPGRRPVGRKHLFNKRVIDDWIESGHQVYLFTQKEVEQIKAIFTALKLGWPVDQSTAYGHDPDNLIELLDECGIPWRE